MTKVLVSRQKLQQAQRAYKKLKVANIANRILLVISLVIIGVLCIKLTDLQAKALDTPIFVGTGSMERIADNMYEIKSDDIQLEELELPPMPQIK